MLTRRSFLKLLAASSASTYMATRASFLIRARAAQINQTPLPASSIPQFTEPIYNLVDGDHAIVDDGINTINLEMREHKAYVLPAGAVPNYTGTWVWSYLKPDQTTRPSYLGPVIVATRGQPTTIRFTNMLGTTVEGDPQATHVLAYTNSVDRTLHWADPLHDEENLENHMAEPPEPYFDTYRGPIPGSAPFTRRVCATPAGWWTRSLVHQ